MADALIITILVLCGLLALRSCLIKAIGQKGKKHGCHGGCGCCSSGCCNRTQDKK